jgi:RND family efflux transporter MFP subunit
MAMTPETTRSSGGELASQLASLQLTRDEPGTSRPWLWPVIVGGVIVLVAAVVFVGFGDRFAVAVVAMTPVLNLQPGQEPPLFVATGTVAAPTTSAIAPRVPARLLRLNVQEGDRVTAGQPLAELDPTDLKLALNQARADATAAQARVSQAQAAVHAAQVRHDRAARLAGTGAGTQSALEDAELDLETAKAQLDVAKGDLGLAEARRTTAELNLKDTTLLAPFGGVVIRILAEPGDWVATGPGIGVLQLADLSTIEVDAEVAEANLGQVRVDMPVEVRLDAMPSRGLPGTVFAVRPNVDPAKATAIAKVRLAASDKVDGATGGDAGTPHMVPLYPGMNGRVNFLSKPLDPQTINAPPKLEVPASALYATGAGSTVLTIGADGRLLAASITVSGNDGDRLILKQGPAAGTLVVQNPQGLKPGRRAKPLQ